MAKPPEIGKTVKAYRIEKNITLSELSDRSGVSKGMLSQIENGTANPTLATAWKISTALGFSLEEFLGDQKKGVCFNLVIYPRTAEQLPKKKKLNVCDLYFGFATNLPRHLAAELPAFIPSEYRRRWGIETGFRVQDNVMAKTTSRKYVVRLLYHLASVLFYYVWNYAYLLLCRMLKRQFVKPLLKLSRLAVHFEGFIIGGLGPPR